MAERRASSSPRRNETVGLVVIALIILAVTLARFWHSIPWSLR
jgi:hypothetical protein